MLPFFCSDSRRHFFQADGRSAVPSYRFVWEGLHPFYVQGYAKRLLIFYFFSVLCSVPFPAFLLLPPQPVLSISVAKSSRVSDLAAQGAPGGAGRAQALSALAVQGSSPREFARLTVPSPSLSPELRAFLLSCPQSPWVF